ncbi:MAG: glycosyltransferase [Rhizobacter sp.]|nr:glycosyltransferase [Chlorobiales bacterium]
MKKVLVIAYYFPPMGLSGVQRTQKFVKYLPDFGWTPVVLTVSPTTYYAYDATLLAELDLNRIQIVRTATQDVTKAAASVTKGSFKMQSERTRRLLSTLSQAVFIPDNKIGWKKYLMAEASRLIESDPDIKLIFSTAPPYTSHLAAIELRQKYALPTVLDFRDPWVENPSHVYFTPYHRRRHEELEEKVILAADKIIAVNRTIKELFLKKYFGRLAHSDVSIITHGYDREDFLKAKPDQRGDKKIRFVYSGVFRDDRTPKPFFLALKKILDETPSLARTIEARFIGLFPKEHQALAESLGLKDVVESRGYKSHAETINENLKADVLWATLGDVPQNDMITLGKLFEYVACGKTIFGILPEGASKQFVQEANGIVAHPKDVNEIAAKMKEIIQRWESGTLPVPSADVVDRYDRRSLTHQLAKEFENLISVD